MGELVGDEPFLLLIGHHIYRSSPSSPLVAKQMLQAYSKHKNSIVGLKKTPLKDVCMFGTVAGVWLHDKPESEEETGKAMMTYVEQVLSDIGMAQYVERFAEEKLLYSQLSTLTSEELKEMNIPLGHRKRMLAHFRGLPDLPQRGSSEGSHSKELRVTEVSEKPTQEYAKQKLVMSD